MRALVVALLLGACAQGPEPIRWGVDACEQCRMILSDRRFGAEFVSNKGRIYKFDDVEELGRYLEAHPQAGQAYVTDGESGNLVPAETAAFILAEAIQSPMGSHVMSFADRTAADRYAQAKDLKGARPLSYEEAIHVRH